MEKELYLENTNLFCAKAIINDISEIVTEQLEVVVANLDDQNLEAAEGNIEQIIDLLLNAKSHIVNNERE